MFRVKDAIEYYLSIIGSAGANHALGNKHLLTIAKMSLHHIWSYKGYDWSWQHRKDSFLTTQGDTIKIVTTHPIKRVDKFYEGTMQPRDGVILNPQSFCGECPTEGTICLPCSCECNYCGDLDLKYANPQDLLCPGFYQVSGSNYQGMGGVAGQIIRIKPKKNLTSLWVSYYRDVPESIKYDDQFPLPTQFATPFAYYMAFISMGRFGQYRAGEEVNFLQVANQMMDDLKEKTNNVPGEMVFTKQSPSENIQFY